MDSGLYLYVAGQIAQATGDIFNLLERFLASLEALGAVSLSLYIPEFFPITDLFG